MPDKGLILFIHGLGGDAAGTWERFPDLVREDDRFAGYDLGQFEYPTSVLRFNPFARKPRIQTLGDALGTLIRNRFPDQRPIVLVAHSLGGLVARSYIVDTVMSNGGLRVSKLLLYAVPNNGAGLARVGRFISLKHPQLRQLCKGSDLIDSLNRSWERLKVSDKVEVRYVVAGDDRVVNETSAKAFPGNPHVEVVFGKDHRSIVKPESRNDLVYEVFETFALQKPAPAPPVAPAPAGEPQYRVIAFDLDGTLIRGLKFSWTLVWEHLGFDEKIYKAGMRRYLHGETTYAQWCEWAVNLYRGKGLKREDFKEIVKELQVTKNLHEGLATLRAGGFVIALISGGIDVMLYETIPDADELFDYIFINKLKFDAKGVVDGVEATPYDFEGKAVALEKICSDHGYTLDRAVFVGEGFNDGHASARAGLSIAYPPRDFELEAASHVLIEEDDLMKVVNHVMGA